MVKLAYTHALGACTARCGGSSPLSPTIVIFIYLWSYYKWTDQKHPSTKGNFMKMKWYHVLILIMIILMIIGGGCTSTTYINNYPAADHSPYVWRGNATTSVGPGRWYKPNFGGESQCEQKPACEPFTEGRNECGERVQIYANRTVTYRSDGSVVVAPRFR